jgi:hypothetical protein
MSPLQRLAVYYEKHTLWAEGRAPLHQTCLSTLHGYREQGMQNGTNLIQYNLDNLDLLMHLSKPDLGMWDFVMDKSGAGAGFLRELRFPLPIYSQSALHNHLHYHPRLAQ